MSTAISFNDRDLLRDKIITTAWYRVRIDEVGESPAKDQSKGPSTNYPVSATVLFNGDTGDTEFAGCPIVWNFNSKAIGFAVGFLQSLGVDVKVGTRYDLRSAETMQVDVFIENDIYNGRTVNRVNHKYRTPKADVTAITQ